MPGKPILIGPLTGGLNSISQAGEAADNQAVSLVNFEVALDQSLTSRPPMEVVAGSLLASSNTMGWNVLGVYRISAAEWYLIAQKWTGTAWSLGHMLSANPATFTQIKLMTAGDVNKVTGYAQVNDMAYFSVGLSSSHNGFKWRKSDATLADWTITGSSSNIIKGSILISYKSRLWLAGQDSAATGSRLFFSTIDATGPKLDTWNKDTDYIDIAPGESGFITAMLPLNNSILVFKNDGTWRFSYPSQVSKGQQDKISGYIGAANQLSVVDFENYVYVYHQGRAYELINNVYNQINRTVKFDLDPYSVDSIAPDVSLSVVTRRLVFRYYNTIYTYFIDTKTWSQWRSYNGNPGRFFQLPSDNSSATPSVYMAASQGNTSALTENYIKDPSFANTQIYVQGQTSTGYSSTFSGTQLRVTKNTAAVDTMEVLLNEEGGTTNYNIPISAGYQMVITGSSTITAGQAKMRLTFQLRNGSTSVVESNVSGAFNVTITAPDQAILCRLSFVATGMSNGGVATLTAPNITRSGNTSPFTLIKISDKYDPSPTPVEYMECVIRTKSYDYQAPSAFKRLFWWGIDVKTVRPIETQAIPVAKQLPVTWGDLENYTHLQLAQGTFGNPLSFLKTSITVTDEADVANSLTENGRIFVKLLKSLRFRQISFEVTMTTFGNADTGPCKLFSITSYVLPKDNTSAKVS
jgi:hypothetical protein